MAYLNARRDARRVRGESDHKRVGQLKNFLEGVVPLDEEVGSGAYGKVFTVRHGGVVYAAKEIHQTLIDSIAPGNKQEIKDLYIRECFHCSALRHPNLVQCVGMFYSSHSTFPIMVMEMMKTSLTSYVKNNQSKIHRTIKISIIHDVFLGLNYLHGHKPPIIHCDLSPNNVMLTSQLLAKIGDLGVAKVMQADIKSRLAAPPGSLDFMPPEVLKANPVYGPSVDVFSFGGIILYVFSEEWPTPLPQDPQTKELITLSEVERRRQYLDKVIIAQLKQLIEQCLSDDPDKRPPIPAVSELIESLKAANSSTNELSRTTAGQDAGEQKKSTKQQGLKAGSVSTEDQKAIVVENGSHFIKAGFGGEDSPLAVFPSVVGTVQNLLDSKEFYVGDEAQINHSNLKLNYPIDQGFILNWDDMEKIWHHTFFKKLCVDPANHPVLLIESRYSTNNHREKMTQIMFETFNTPSMYITVKHALSLYASGRTTGMVIQLGASMSSFLPVHEGYGVPVAWQTLNVGGRDLTDYVKRLLNHRYPSLSISQTIACDIKEKHCSMRPPTASATYKLPDGNCITIDKERSQCSEILFNPALIGFSTPGIHHTCNQAISLCGNDIREELYKNIVLAGGNSLFPGISEKLQEEVTYLAPSTMNVKVIAPPDRKYSAWIGGSMLASMSSFQPMWVTKQEYDEHGPTIVCHKCI